jgi:uncharacterized phiE125 gp8 family phage protein
MGVVVITAPGRFMDPDLVKSHLRVDHDEDDALIEAYTDAAVAGIDGPAGWLGRSLALQTLEVRLDRFPTCDSIVLPYGPVIDVLSVKYDDADGAEQTVDPADYDLLAGDGFGTLQRGYDTSWPSNRLFRDAVRIRYRAGYVVDIAQDPPASNVPGAIVAAILLYAGHLYQNREAVKVGEIVTTLPLGVEALLAPFRILTV